MLVMLEHQFRVIVSEATISGSDIKNITDYHDIYISVSNWNTTYLSQNLTEYTKWRQHT